MRQLSGLDASFLFLETPQMPMHVGALHLFELPRGYRGSYVRDLRRHVEQRLPLLPVFRRRLWWMPLNLANPAWVDVVPDLSQHIVEIKLPKATAAGDAMQALEAQVGLLHPVLLDRSLPLWKMHVFTGLAPGPDGRKRVGVYTQLHHAAVDGQAAVALANTLLDVTPEPRTIEIVRSTRRKVFRLSMAEMLRGALGNEIAQVSRIVRDLPSTVGTLSGAARTAVGSSALFGLRKGRVSNLTLAPATPFNVSVGTGRAFAAVSLPMVELKALGKSMGATINDMVLAVCSGALRSYLLGRGVLPKKSLVAAVPISLRAAGDTSSDNQASMSVISLGTHLPDAGARLAHVKAATAAMKSAMGSVRSILPTDYPSIGVPWLLEAATALVGKARVADRVGQVTNVTISNVPGPPVPLYMAGARMLTNYPTSIVVHGMALNITVQSYNQSLDFGLMADADAAPDVKALADAITGEFDALRALRVDAGAAPVPAASPAARVRRAAGAGSPKKVTSARAASPPKAKSRPAAKRAPGTAATTDADGVAPRRIATRRKPARA
ncbi:wax ester/triacylglycerol synthase family O-acyltransferase [Comamonadaceae bacterium G21597-S1]|nr:wax ester/triacylglycerol synthase family O-acyltransferase [Comamonadaceae bacterium G21597-S1]